MIIFDNYLTNQGLTEEKFKTALKLSDEDLAGHTLSIKHLKEPKKKGTFWALQLFLDDEPKGITIGIPSYKESIIKETLEVLLEGQKLRGSWPKNQPLLQWIKKNAHPKQEKRKQKKQQAREERNLFPRTLQSVLQFQKNMQTVPLLIKAYEVFHQEILVEHRIEEALKLEKMLSAAIAYKQTKISARAVTATQKGQEVFLWDSEQNLILTQIGGKIEYQSIVFTVAQINTAYERAQTIKAKIAQKKTETKINNLLAQIPSALDAQIKALQQKVPWDKIPLVKARDLNFLEQYNHPHFNFYQAMGINIQTQKEMNDWISAWIARLEEIIAAPSLVDAATQTILKLIASSPKYGIQTYAMWLGNSKAKTLKDKDLDQKFRYALKDNTIVSIATKIERIIGYEWLTITKVGTHHLPVLVLTNGGKKVLQASKDTPIIHSKAVVAQPAIDTHYHWLKEIQEKEHTAYVNFLNTPESVANITNWTEKEVVEMQQTLNEYLKGWQVLAQWKLCKHPIKYKALQRLL